MEESIALASCSVGVGGGKDENGKNTRNRLKSRIQAQLKSASSWFPSLLPSRRGKNFLCGIFSDSGVIFFVFIKCFKSYNFLNF